jgi:tRNA-specific adenosine deaminase 3
MMTQNKMKRSLQQDDGATMTTSRRETPSSPTTESFNRNDNDMFVEIRSRQEDTRPKTVSVHILHVEPQQCSKLVKQLGRDLPLNSKELDLSHLKRVRTPRATSGPSSSSDSQTTKKPKILLQVLVGAVGQGSAFKSIFDKLVELYGPMETIKIPGRPPSSTNEHKEFNKLWPTTFFPLKSEEYQEKQLALTPDDVEQMKSGMEQLLNENRASNIPFVMILDPSSGKVVSTSAHEQGQQASDLTARNPLATPILLALQGVSRLERKAVMTLDAPDFSKGQYLCTGYDLYSSFEPTVFESMACVHYRLRRLIFGNGPAPSTGRRVLHGGCSAYKIQCLPGTNHNYRAFRYVPDAREAEQVI